MNGATPQRDRDDGLRIELFIRADAFGAQRQKQGVIERVCRLEDHGEIDRTVVRHWPSRLRADEGGEFLDRVAEFERWADERDLRLSPCFERHEVEALLGDERYERVVLPIMCLGVYKAERLRHVAPHVGDGGVHTVHDCIDELEADLERTRTGRPNPNGTVTPR